MASKDQNIKVVATFEVMNDDETKIVQTHEKAWIATLDNYPAQSKFIGFLRKNQSNEHNS